MYFLDTDTLSLAYAGHDRVADHIKQVGNDQIATTVVNAIETLRGRHEFLLKAADGKQLRRAQRLLDETEKLLDDMPIKPIDEFVAAKFDQFREIRSLKKIGRADLLIGCIALAHRATLVTRNVKHFRQIAGLNVENWID